MIEDPPLLQIRRNFQRLDPSLVKRFAGVPPAHEQLDSPRVRYID